MTNTTNAIDTFTALRHLMIDAIYAPSHSSSIYDILQPSDRTTTDLYIDFFNDIFDNDDAPLTDDQFALALPMINPATDHDITDPTTLDEIAFFADLLFASFCTEIALLTARNR